jgi:membrane protein
VSWSPARAARRLLFRTVLTTWRATVEFVDDRAHRPSAQIAFYAALSSVPLALLLVASFGLVIPEAEVRARVIDTVFAYVPLAGEEDRVVLERAIAGSLASAGRLGAFSILLLIAAATGIMSALRNAINVAWDLEGSPPVLRRKALDLALVLGVTIALALSLLVTLPHRVAASLDAGAEGGWVAAAVLDGVGEVMPFAFTALIVLFLYRILPMERPRVREIWPGALVAAALLGLLKGALELYFEHFADFGALYGSLGALMALLLFAFGSSVVVVYGAEFASEWARLPSDEEVEREVRAGWRRVIGARGLSRRPPERGP